MTKSHNNSPNYSKKLTPKDFTELFLKIDSKLKLLQDFWDKYQDFLYKNAWLCTKKQNQPIIDDLNEPLSVSEGLRRNAQVVINQSTWETAEIGFLESENFPRLHRNVFDNPKFFSGLSEEARKGVLQFYDNFDSITSIYEKIKSLGLKVVRRTNLDGQLERLVTETLERGNPLKGTQTLTSHDCQSQQKKARPEQEDKIKCRKIAKETWYEYQKLDIVHMIQLPAIIQIVGKLYIDKTVRGWIKEVAPDRAKQPGKRSREIRLEQKKICEKLGIKYDFKL